MPLLPSLWSRFQSRPWWARHDSSRYSSTRHICLEWDPLRKRLSESNAGWRCRSETCASRWRYPCLPALFREVPKAPNVRIDEQPNTRLRTCIWVKCSGRHVGSGRCEVMVLFGFESIIGKCPITLVDKSGPLLFLTTAHAASWCSPSKPCPCR